ncbi:hypothetical protein [Melaminivora alkalimesophila]|uniref:hypothetical protein n=1 Tax=Melaminivora alkalimesophila TaxID=1165852 RepID=UPI00114643DF|nr:hypothetical protein [Melaminivora alkalimesophila]
MRHLEQIPSQKITDPFGPSVRGNAESAQKAMQSSSKMVAILANMPEETLHAVGDGATAANTPSIAAATGKIKLAFESEEAIHASCRERMLSAISMRVIVSPSS